MDRRKLRDFQINNIKIKINLDFDFDFDFFFVWTGRVVGCLRQGWDMLLFAVEITIPIASKILPTHHVGQRMVVLTVD